VLRNAAAFWNRDRLGIRLAPGIDEVSLALVADAWSRTYRSRALSFAAAPGTVTTRNGMRIRPDRIAAAWPAAATIGVIAEPPARALDTALVRIGSRYGRETAAVVAAQLEYPGLPAR